MPRKELINISGPKRLGISNWPSESIQKPCAKGCSIWPGNVVQWLMLLRRQPETLGDEVLHPLNGVVAQGKSISTTAAERLVGEGGVGPAAG